MISSSRFEKKKTKKKYWCRSEMGYCPFEHRSCVTIRPLYRDIVGLEGGWFKEELYCKMVKCIAIEVADLGENCIAIHYIVLQRRKLGGLNLGCNTLECIAIEGGWKG